LTIGEISNDKILRKESEIWTDSDESDYRNKIFLPDCRLNKDFKIVPLSIWEFFQKKYGGIEIKRYYKKGYGYGAEIEATLKEF